MMKKITCAVFDLDGTLIDSMPAWHQVDLEYLSSINREFTEAFGQKVKSMSFLESAGFIKKEFNLDKTVDEIVDELFSLVRNHYENDIWLKPGAYESLRLFHEQGIKIYIATANHADISISTIKRNGIDIFIDDVVSCDIVGKGKRESPAVFFEAMKMAGSDVGSTLVVEDALHAVKTAALAGFSTAAVYDRNSEKETEEIKRFADVYFYNLNDFCDYFRNNNFSAVRK